VTCRRRWMPRRRSCRARGARRLPRPTPPWSRACRWEGQGKWRRALQPRRGPAAAPRLEPARPRTSSTWPTHSQPPPLSSPITTAQAREAELSEMLTSAQSSLEAMQKLHTTAQNQLFELQASREEAAVGKQVRHAGLCAGGRRPLGLKSRSALVGPPGDAGAAALAVLISRLPRSCPNPARSRGSRRQRRWSACSRAWRRWRRRSASCSRGWWSTRRSRWGGAGRGRRRPALQGAGLLTGCLLSLGDMCSWPLNSVPAPPTAILPLAGRRGRARRRRRGGGDAAAGARDAARRRGAAALRPRGGAAGAAGGGPAGVAWGVAWASAAGAEVRMRPGRRQRSDCLPCAAS
jgi:hypothetical protein